MGHVRRQSTVTPGERVSCHTRQLNGVLRFRLKRVREQLWQGLRIAEGMVLILAGWAVMLWCAWHIMAFLHGGE